MSNSSPPPYSPPPGYIPHNPQYPTGNPYNPFGVPDNPSNALDKQAGVHSQPPVIPQSAHHEVHFHRPQENTESTTNVFIIATAFGPHSQIVFCPICHHTKPTKVKCEASTKTHLYEILLCLFAGGPCCLLPYCMDSCQDINHYCINCGALLGTYE